MGNALSRRSDEERQQSSSFTEQIQLARLSFPESSETIDWANERSVAAHSVINTLENAAYHRRSGSRAKSVLSRKLESISASRLTSRNSAHASNPVSFDLSPAQIKTKKEEKRGDGSDGCIESIDNAKFTSEGGEFPSSNMLPASSRVVGAVSARDAQMALSTRLQPNGKQDVSRDCITRPITVYRTSGASHTCKEADEVDITTFYTWTSGTDDGAAVVRSVVVCLVSLVLGKCCCG